jgi:hypothetical protein
VSQPRIVLTGPEWRVVALELPDAHGVARTEYIIEVTEPKDKDRLGVQRWRELNDKSAWGDWMRVARRFLDELLKHAGEKPEREK